MKEACIVQGHYKGVDNDDEDDDENEDTDEWRGITYTLEAS
jgi:hypothetical protein